MHVIIPAGDIAQYLLELTTQYLEQFNNPLLTEPLRQRKADFEHKVAKAHAALAQYDQMLTQAKAYNLDLPKFTGFTAHEIQQWRPVSDKFVLADATKIVHAMIEDFINVNMYWTRQTTCDVVTDHKLNEMFPAWNTERGLRATQHYHKHVLEPVFDMVQQVIQQFLSKQTWDMWYIRCWGRDVVVEKGEDYRVLDWQRRMDSGEWSMSAIPPNPQADADDYQGANAQSLDDSRAMELYLRQVGRFNPPGLNRNSRTIPGAGVPKLVRDVVTFVNPNPREVPKVIFQELPASFTERTDD